MRDNNTQHVQTPLSIPDSSYLTAHSQKIISQFENKILSVLKTYPPGTTFLAAVSGGADSMAMLAALCAAKALCALPEQSDFDFKTAVCHIEHGIRPAQESRGDADFVRAFCQTSKIKCRIKHIPPGRAAALSQRKGCGIEAAARYFRHKALSKSAAALGENTVILIAHTKDDLLETALMRVLRGSGPAGLAGIKMKNEKLGIVKKRVCRPLLSLSRTDVVDYLTAKDILWREDSTNSDIKFLRNRIRRQLVPLLNEAFPAWKAGAAALAETQSLAADFLAGEADLRIKWNEKKFTANRHEQEGEAVCALFSARLWRTAGSKSAKKNSGRFIFTSEECFFSQPQIIREEAVFSGINKLSSSRYKIPNKSIRRSVVRRFCAGELNCADFGSVRINREGGEIFITGTSGGTRNEFFERGVSRLIKRCQS